MSNEINQKHKDYLFPSVATYYNEPLVIDRGEGCYLYDKDGKEYLDFFGGILTVSVGHCNPKVTEKINEQTKKLQHTSTLYPTGNIVDLAEKLAQITPGKLQKSYFTNSGTEADETAIFLAQHYSGKQEIIALRHGYSGRSLLAMSLTAHAAWRHGGTHIAGIKHAVNPYCYRCPFGLSYPNCDIKCARDIEDLIQTTTCGEIAGFLAEPIQGVGGFITPPKEYFQLAIPIIRKYGGVFICDEVQTGFGRTGQKMFGIEHWGVEPEIMTCAKGMANGVPIGVTIATSEVADSFTGLTISTFGGNPVSMAAALATIGTIEEENLADHVHEMGNYMNDRLLGLQQKYPVMGDVRGMGLMIGIEFVGENKIPDPGFVIKLFEETKNDGLLIGKGGIYGNVVRLSPPMNVTRTEIDDFIHVFDAALGRCKDSN
jgi:4-aminobutyrate aminotransferase